MKDWLKAALRKAKIAARIVMLIVSLITFARRLSKAMKEKDIEVKKKSILEAIAKLMDSIPYDLPGLLYLEFKKNGGNES